MILLIFAVGVLLVLLWAVIAILIKRHVDPTVFSRWHADE